MFENLKGIAIITIPEGANPQETILAALTAINEDGLPDVVTLDDRSKVAGINLYSLKDLIQKCSNLEMPNVHIIQKKGKKPSPLCKKLQNYKKLYPEDDIIMLESAVHLFKTGKIVNFTLEIDALRFDFKKQEN